MTTPLTSVWAKIRRAEEHLETLEGALREFRRNYPQAIVREFDAISGEKRWRLVSDPVVPGPAFSLWIGEIIYDFRSALDHLAWQLVIINGQEPTTRTAFPIFNDDERFRRESRSKVRGMDPEAIAAIEAMQPCYGPNRHRNSIFWMLETLSNIDKHRHFNLIVGATMGGFWFPGLPSPSDGFIHEGPIEKGTVLAKVSKEHANVEFAPAFDVAFGDAPMAPTSQGVQFVLIATRELLRQEVQWFQNTFFS